MLSLAIRIRIISVRWLLKTDKNSRLGVNLMNLRVVLRLRTRNKLSSSKYKSTRYQLASAVSTTATNIIWFPSCRGLLLRWLLFYIKLEKASFIWTSSWKSKKACCAQKYCRNYSISWKRNLRWWPWGRLTPRYKRSKIRHAINTGYPGAWNLPKKWYDAL